MSKLNFSIWIMFKYQSNIFITWYYKLSVILKFSLCFMKSVLVIIFMTNNENKFINIENMVQLIWNYFGKSTNGDQYENFLISCFIFCTQKTPSNDRKSNFTTKLNLFYYIYNWIFYWHNFFNKLWWKNQIIIIF